MEIRRKERFPLKKIIKTLRNDVVLSASFGLAVLSCFFVPPSPAYIGYLDLRTLILLFCLMLITGGMRKQNLFRYTGNLILSRVKTTKGLAFTLVFLCFVSSMLITNDIALITFVPFGILLLGMAGMDKKLCYTITLMTIGANLGSMLTPIGNPQNLYLYSLSDYPLQEFLKLMLPYTLLAGILLFLFILLGYEQERIRIIPEKLPPLERRPLLLYVALFFLCLLSVARILPPVLLLLITSACIFLLERKLFREVDYSLLLTFVFFFIFVGNLKNFQLLHGVILGLLQGRERLISVLLSQIISNVPAALLLSGYTENIREIIIGTDLGGLGTMIASMASLISYKQVALAYPRSKKRYLLIFTLCNILFLLLLFPW